MNELQRMIFDAHGEVERNVPGARKKLERLQAEFRTSGTIIRPGGSCGLVGQVDQAPRRKTRRAIARSQDIPQRPYWQLGEPEPNWRLR